MPDKRAADLIHRLARRFLRRKPFLPHHALDVFHDDNRVIDEQTDGQHETKERERIDRNIRRPP
jgi:hypothetical protein